MSRRDYAGGAQPTKTTVPFTAADVVLSVVALVGWPDGVQGPFAVAIDRDTDQEEKILCSTVNGNDLTVIQRGYDGTTARDHSPNATVEHVFTAIDADEANDHVNRTTGVHGIPVNASVVGTTGDQTLQGKKIDLSPATGNVITNLPLSASTEIAQALAAEATARQQADSAEATARANADTAHVNAVDPHPQYMTQPESDARYRLIGQITMYAGAVAPAGWLICDGSVISSQTYPELVAVLGSTTLPDLRTRVPRGAGAGYALASNGGADTHVIAETNLPPHAHSINHDHPVATTSSVDLAGSAISTVAATADATGSGQYHVATYAAIPAHTHTVDLPALNGNSGNGNGVATPLDTKDPYYVVNFIIRAL